MCYAVLDKDCKSRNPDDQVTPAAKQLPIVRHLQHLPSLRGRASHCAWFGVQAYSSCNSEALQAQMAQHVNRYLCDQTRPV